MSSESTYAEIRFELDTTRWVAAVEAIKADLDKVAARVLRNRAAELNRQADELDPTARQED